MPGVSTPTTTVDGASTHNPVDTFVLRYRGQQSILDTVFVSKTSQRAVYATTTSAAQTSLWRVAANGTMTEVARFDWEYEVQIVVAGDGSLRNSSKPGKKCSMLTFGGKMLRTDEFLQKGKGWFSSDSRIFNVDGVEFKWKSGTEAPDGINTHNHAYHDVWKIWRCVSSRLDPSTTSSTPSIALPVMRSPYPAAATDTAAQPVQTPEGRPTLALETSFLSEPHHDQRSQPSASAARSILSAILNAPAPPTILARFAPPQIGLEHNELSLFPQPLSDQRANDHFLECLLISTVILAVRKGEWKQVQTVVGVSALQAVFMAEAVGEVPPYTPRSRQAASTAGGNTRTVRSRAHSDRSRRPPEVMAGARPNPSENHGQANDSDQTPLLPQRNAHRSSRSSPFNIFPTPPFNLGTISGQARRAFFPGPGHDRPASNRVASRRPATADSAFAGDGVFNRRRPSLQVANPAYVPRSGDLVAAPGMGSPPPAYS